MKLFLKTEKWRIGSMKNIKALVLALFTLAIAQSSFGQTTASIPNIAGSYQTKDKTSTGEKMTLVLLDGTSLGRPGSYFALLIENKLRQLHTYIVDPSTSSNMLLMYPTTVSRDGEVGIGDVKTFLDEKSYYPSLKLTYGGQSGNQHVFSVTPAGDNSKGWQGEAQFDRKGDVQWLAIQPGKYEGHKGGTINVSSVDSDGNAIITSLKSRELPAASYQAREKLPSFTYTMRADKQTNHGVELPTMPSHVAFFVKKGNDTRMLITGPSFGQVLGAPKFTKGVGK
jgi:hypothetical protein